MAFYLQIFLQNKYILVRTGLSWAFHSKLNFKEMENYHQAMKVLIDLHIRRNDKLIERSVSKRSRFDLTLIILVAHLQSIIF